MKIFVTGASGYVGKVVVEHAVRAGHVVEGLARNQESAAKVSQLGARPVVGDLRSFDVLAAAASRADAILHLAYIHDFSLDHSIVIDTEVKAVTALATGARGKPIITTSGTAVAAPAPDGGETDETAPINEGFVLGKRARAERAVLDLTKLGAHIVSVRLPRKAKTIMMRCNRRARFTRCFAVRLAAIIVIISHFFIAVAELQSAPRLSHSGYRASILS